MEYHGDSLLKLIGRYPGLVLLFAQMFVCSFHSINLFGNNKGNRSPFIIDGIVCKENDKDSIITVEAQKESVDNNVDAMIERIKGKLKEKTMN